uniref:Uncharacterized protein n=1 Tax=Tanacetum cinerariifolium TaxID=118510 RepID=A0A6L2KD52_TANCI|nr:hypothetical protein [Tanacetum cinerariifolium]
MFITSRLYLDDEYVAMTRSYFIQYTQQAIPEFHDTLIKHLEYVKKSIDEIAQHKRKYDSWVNERQMQTTEENVDTSKALDASLVDKESSGTKSKEQDTCNRSGNNAHADDADIRLIYDEEPMTKNLERQLNKETLHEKELNSDLRVIKVQFEPFIHSKLLEPSNYNSYDLETRRDFKEYTQMEAQTFKETIIQHMNSIKQCIVKKENHEQVLQERLNERKLQIQGCTFQEVKTLDAILEDNAKKRCMAIPEFRDTLIQHLKYVKSIDERAQHKREYDNWVNEIQMQTTKEKVDMSKALDASSVDIESNIRPIYDEEPMTEVQTTAEINVFAIGQQHTEQPEFNNKGEVDQNAKECHNTCPLPAILTDN